MTTSEGWRSCCPRCRRTTELDDGVTGCERCRSEGVAMPLMPERLSPAAPDLPGPVPVGVGALWRWREHLPPVGVPVSLGEGGTPLTEVRLPGVEGRVLMKDERANPTSSFKDRLAGVVVSRARRLGAETLVLSSTGNAGVAVAAYAAAAGLQTVVLAGGSLPAATAAAIEALGGRVLSTRTHVDRWTAARVGVEELGWFPVTNYLVPPVSSNPVGVHAYRTIAYEIAEACDWAVPDWVVVPVSRGDGLFGVWAGFAELVELGRTTRVPRMLAVERFPSLGEALARGLEQPAAVPVDGEVQARSISDPQGTAMALLALRESGGDAVAASDAEIEAAWRGLAARGQLVELSSAAVVHGVEHLARQGALGEDSTVVVLGTAGPYAQPTLPMAGNNHLLTDPTSAAELRARTAGSRASRRHHLRWNP